MTLPLGQLEGKYEVLYKIKEGGMGAVYKVRHLLLDHVRVVKVIRPQFVDDKAAQRRFRYEAGTAIHLHHPNIAQLYDFVYDEQDGTSFMVMEYIDGVTLEETIDRGGALDCGLVVEIARQTLDALAYLHGRMFIHRDVSPDNLMLTRGFDGAPRVKVIDLGIVKHIAATTGVTRTGAFVGKARYSSPEAFSGTDVKPDERADLYSLGVVLYEALTGVCPIGGSGFREIASAHMFQPPLPFDEADAAGRVPSGLRRVVLKALEKAREDRFASAEVMLAALAPFAAGAAELAQALRGHLDPAAVAGGDADLPRAPEAAAARRERSRPPSADPRPDRRVSDEASAVPPAAAELTVQPSRRDETERGPHETDGETPVEASVHRSGARAREHGAGEHSAGEWSSELVEAREPESRADPGTARRSRDAAQREAGAVSDRRARVEQSLAAARWFIGRNAFTAARWQLAEAEKLDPDHAELRVLRGRLVEGRRRQRIDALLTAADEHLERGAFLRVRYRLERLRRLDSDLPELEEFRDRLAAARRTRAATREQARLGRRRVQTERQWARDERRQTQAERRRAAGAARTEQALARHFGRVDELLAAGELEEAGLLLENVRAIPHTMDS